MTKAEVKRALQEVAAHYNAEKAAEYGVTLDEVDGVKGAFKAAIADDKAADRYGRIGGESAQGGSYLTADSDVFDAVCAIYGTRPATAEEYRAEYPQSRLTEDDGIFFFRDRQGRARYSGKYEIWARYAHAIRTALDYADKFIKSKEAL